ncbi:hypothetical protein [Microbacterium sp.]|uniref:hypothetical protein n=1 Tax=Microbacterium sp. TaxID=51671 RepID=UPI003F6EEB34
MTRRPVVLTDDTAGGRYRAAVAELPLTAQLAERAAGAVVVVTGVEWVDAAFAAAEAGAAALIVADPAVAPADDLRRLGQRIVVPVVVERPLLRPDLAAQAVRGRGDDMPRVITVDAVAGAARRAVVVRDAVGWIRALAGDDLDVRSAAGGLALLETSAGIAATLSVAATSRGEGWIRARALGEVRTEVEVTGRDGRLATSSSAGRLRAPGLFESSERLALRRAIEAADSGERSADLAELLADSLLAAECDGVFRA